MLEVLKWRVHNIRKYVKMGFKSNDADTVKDILQRIDQECVIT